MPDPEEPEVPAVYAHAQPATASGGTGSQPEPDENEAR